MISSLYAAVARRRREWYAARPDARRRLRRPVISIGNIAAGGRGKTPFTAFVARLLMDSGERPAILSRGYARTSLQDGAVVVRDADAIRADLARAGDEPLMLARQLPGAIVITSPDRYVGGRLAEHHFGATVHLLDDGFQHFEIDRDADIVLVANADLNASTFPAGRLREPPDVLMAASAIIAVDGMPRPFDHVDFFTATRHVGNVVFDPPGVPERVFAFAGIAEPQRFFEALAHATRTVTGTRAFRDHHPYSARDVAALIEQGRRSGATALVTTEKDYVRLLPHRPLALPVGFAPLTMEVEPRDAFRAWLASSLDDARDNSIG